MTSVNFNAAMPAGPDPSGTPVKSFDQFFSDFTKKFIQNYPETDMPKEVDLDKETHLDVRAICEGEVRPISDKLVCFTATMVKDLVKDIQEQVEKKNVSSLNYYLSVAHVLLSPTYVDPEDTKKVYPGLLPSVMYANGAVSYEELNPLLVDCAAISGEKFENDSPKFDTYHFCFTNLVQNTKHGPLSSQDFLNGNYHVEATLNDILSKIDTWAY